MFEEEGGSGGPIEKELIGDRESDGTARFKSFDADLKKHCQGESDFTDTMLHPITERREMTMASKQ